jgi:transcription elongation factor GreA
MKPIYLTKEGAHKLEQELKHIKEVKRPDIITKISHARGLGDLSENAEYHAAKDELIRLERQIYKLESTLSRVQIIDKNDINADRVRILTRVLVFNRSKEIEIEYTMVSPEEADPIQRKISIESPVGKGLMGKQVGDLVKVEAPSGVVTFEIKAIHPPQ